MADINTTQSRVHSTTRSVDNQSSTDKGKADLDVLGEIHTLLGRLGESLVEPVAYDTAWIARLGHIDINLATQALKWLRAQQLTDGSWGALTPIYHHDRVICTLAAIVALARNNAPEDKPRIYAALPALQYSLANLHTDIAGRTVAFEMLLPSLVAEAKSLGLEVNDPDGIVERMSRLRDAKLAHAPTGLIDRYTTLGFSAEWVGPDGLHLLDVDNLQQEDGSVSVSPAATAFFVAYVRPDPAALHYLRRVAHYGGAPPVTSSDIFERAWGLWNFTRGRNFDPAIVAYGDSLLDEFTADWSPTLGIAHDSIVSVQDGDDTGLVYELLAQFHHTPDLAALRHFEGDTHFRSFDLESHASVSTNIHILGALRQAQLHEKHPLVQKIVNFLQNEQTPQHFWVDKWHTSPYYSTSHAIIVCTGYFDQLVEDSVAWLLETQNSNGSWGYFSPTAEETAYSLQALMALHQQGLPIPHRALERGIVWLAEHSDPPYPPLWIIKTLYCPTLVVHSAILGALRQYECEFGSLPEKYYATGT